MVLIEVSRTAVPRHYLMSDTRGYSKKGIPEGEAFILTASANYHGRTMTSLSASTSSQLREGAIQITDYFLVPQKSLECQRTSAANDRFQIVALSCLT